MNDDEHEGSLAKGIIIGAPIAVALWMLILIGAVHLYATI